MLVARRRAQLDQLADELAERNGIRAEVLVADLTVAQDIARVEQRIAAAGAPIDLLVNNAGGIAQHTTFLESDRDVLHDDAALNALTTLRLTHAAVQAMAARGGGAIVNVSAGVGSYPAPGAAAYGAAKAFVNSLSAAVAHELRGTGVGVTAVCPGFTRTGLQQRVGMRVDRVPAWLWMDPGQVARRSLRAAVGPRHVSSLGVIGEVAASLGHHLPRRLWLPLVAAGQARLAGHPTASPADAVRGDSRPRRPGALVGWLVTRPRTGRFAARVLRAPNEVPVLAAWVTRLHSRLLRVSAGRLRRSWLFAAGQPVLTLTTTGRRSGRTRSTPVACFTAGDRLVIAGMNLGRETTPAWALNLTARPEAAINLRGRTIAVVACQARGAERDALWRRWVELQPSAAAFQALAGREIPLFVLDAA